MYTETLPNLTFAIALTELAPSQPVQACSRDYGFDFDEEEIARELLAPLPAGLAVQAIPQEDTDEPEFNPLWPLC